MSLGNISMAIMTVGLVWIAVHYDVWDWWMIVLILVGLSIYTYPAFKEERKQLLLAQIRYYEEKAAYYFRSARS